MGAEASGSDALSLARQLGIFTTLPHARGRVVWLPRGLALSSRLRSYLRAFFPGYEVSTPAVFDTALWERSGHLAHYRDKMFLLEGGEQALKPMNCPGHFMLAAQMALSRKRLPFRISELGLVHRREAYGAIKVPFRASSFTQDDGHVLCEWAQLRGLLASFLRRAQVLYMRLGFPKVAFELSLTESPSPLIRLANRLMRKMAWAIGPAPLRVNESEGAFYGPKFEVHLEDRAGKAWQCGTIQLDLLASEAFGLSYSGPAGAPRRPLVLHHACLGSVERFIGVLLEGSQGCLDPCVHPRPLAAFVTEPGLAKDLPARVRACLAACSAREISAAVQEAKLERVPIMIFYGERERAAGSVTVSLFGKGEATERLVPLAGLEGWLGSYFVRRALSLTDRAPGS